MSGNHFYLLTILPSLPKLGGVVDAEYATEKIREEGSEAMLLLADLLEVENEIEKCGLQHFVLKNSDYTPNISTRLPEEFRELFASFKDSEEATWLTDITAAWFELITLVGHKTGSKLMKDWAEWEYGLRTQLRIERLRNTGKLSADVEAIIPEFMKIAPEKADHQELIDLYKSISEPMQAEKLIDEARIDFLHESSIQYSFSNDELVAYMLELRIHQRYTRLSPEKGRKILEEVTRL